MKKDTLTLLVATILIIMILNVIVVLRQEAHDTVEIPTQWHIPPLDLRGYEMDHFLVEQWFLERINYHRELYGVHPYSLYAPAVLRACLQSYFS